MANPFKERSREELLRIISAMAETYHAAAEEYRRDAVEQIRSIECGTVANFNETVHRAINAIAFLKLSSQLDEILGIACGKRSAARWLLSE